MTTTDAPGHDALDVQAELAAVRAELAELRALLDAGAPPPASDQRTDRRGPETEPRTEPTTSNGTAGRRSFLKYAVGGVAAAGAATAVAATGAEPALAATGGSMLIGSNNAPSAPADTTRIYNPSSSTLMAQGLRVSNFTNAEYTLGSTQRAAIVGTTSGNDDSGTIVRTGVYGRSESSPAGGQGVFGSAGGPDNPFTQVPGNLFGVFGSAGAGGIGVMGYVPGGTGVAVIGQTDGGTAVQATSFNGLSLMVAGGGRMQQNLRSSNGAPTSGAFNAGEQVRDAKADLYLCVAGGSPGTWRKVTAQHPAYADAGGSLNLLSRPIRVVDTRGGAPVTNGGNKLTPNVPLSCQITGQAVGGITVPAGAKAVLGNLTITGATSEGWAAVWPTGAFPGTSNINFSVASATPAIANFFVSALDSGGKLQLMAVASTHAVIDVFGFVY